MMWMLALACSGDPVLEAARKEEAEAARGSNAVPASGGAQPVGAGGGGGHPIDGGASGGPEGVAGEPQAGVPADPAPGVPTDPPPGEGIPGVGSPEAPTPGVPDEPEPGDPNVPPPGDAAPPPGGQRGVPVEPGSDVPSVTLRGSVGVSGWVSGPVRIDIFDADPLDFTGTKQLVSMVTVDEPGAFEVKVPIETGRVWLSAFNDENSDGRPGPVEPTGVYPLNPVDVSADVSGVTLRLERREPPQGEVDVGL